jgi:hypothetical protein
VSSLYYFQVCSKEIIAMSLRATKPASLLAVTLLAAVCLSMVSRLSPAQSGAPTVVVHQGICDASAVVDLGRGRFAVADDELNLLVVYQAGQGGEAIYKTEVSKFLDVVKQPKPEKAKKQGKRVKPKNPQETKQPKVKEVDMEGAARVGDTIYWITSHGRKKSGKAAEERMQLFATTIQFSDDGLELVPTGTPYNDLLDDLLADARYANLGLQAAAEKAPKEPGGLNIEAMTDHIGGSLLIGFRSPLVRGQALVATLLNPHEVIEGEAPRFGDPKFIDLGGRGLRGMSSHEGTILIAANDPEGDDHRPQLFRWDGESTNPTPLDVVDFGDFNPEGITLLPDFQGGKLLLLSDDGVRPIGPDQCPCKDLKDHSQRQFRSMTVDWRD